MKVKMEDILTKSAKLEVGKIDFNDPAVIEKMEKCRAEQMECLKRKRVDRKYLELEVTI